LDNRNHFAEVILPLPVRGTFTYRIPGELAASVKPGMRVVVQFGKRKIYTAVVARVHENPPGSYEAKNILSVLDPSPVVNDIQFRFWQWIASYYLCYEGEVMAAAMPSAFRLASESKILLNKESIIDQELNEKETLLVESLRNRKTVDVSEVSKILGQQKVIPVINTLLEKGIILMEEEIHDRYRPKKETFIRLSGKYADNEDKLRDLFNILEKKARKQLELLMNWYHLTHQVRPGINEVSRSELLKSGDSSAAALDGLIRKKIFEPVEKVISRLDEELSTQLPEIINYSDAQLRVFDEIKDAFREKDVALLHGVTSSGKTEIYIKLIRETLERGKQVLYLLPEIALTTQIISRLKKYFGDRVGVYHSRFNENERVEIWNHVIRQGSTAEVTANRYDIILGARSSVFLPYQNLGLVIVDEEHDSSFKQYDPAPRYHGRDAALYLAHLHGAKTILGSATPSLESFFNAREGKYALVELQERYGNLEMPGIRVVNVRSEARQNKMRSHFSLVLMDHLKEALANHEQSILFQNRRGFSLRLECETCNWMPTCRNCDVTLVYHKQNNQLRCHYCGYSTRIPAKCPECRGTALKMKGFGTEKIEEELGIFFPGIKIARMDLDTTRSKHSLRKIIGDFEQRKIDILVGTQMVTKGLDFDNVTTVGILNADNMLSFPDFRAAERSFQLMEQVSGRAGRKFKKGKVIIQTFNPNHPVIHFVMNHDYLSFYEHQMVERRKFKYPPYYRLIHLKIRHRDPSVLSKAAASLASNLRKRFGNRILGPEYPIVARIQNYYIKQILIKIERNESVSQLKLQLNGEIERFLGEKKFPAIRLTADVDPQ